jgi:hypothetical protein
VCGVEVGEATCAEQRSARKKLTMRKEFVSHDRSPL